MLLLNLAWWGYIIITQNRKMSKLRCGILHTRCDEDAGHGRVPFHKRILLVHSEYHLCLSF